MAFVVKNATFMLGEMAPRVRPQIDVEVKARRNKLHALMISFCYSD